MFRRLSSVAGQSVHFISDFNMMVPAGKSPKFSLSDGALWGICGAVILVMGVATAGITVWLIRKEKREFEAKTLPTC